MSNDRIKEELAELRLMLGFALAVGASIVAWLVQTYLGKGWFIGVAAFVTAAALFQAAWKIRAHMVLLARRLDKEE